MAVGIGEGTRVSPAVASSFHDDLCTCILRPAHQLVDLCICSQPYHDEALVRTAGRAFATTDHPPEADRGNQHHAQADGDLKLQWFGNAIGSTLAHCHEPEGRIEGMRCQTILGWQADRCSVELHDFPFTYPSASVICPPRTRIKLTPRTESSSRSPQNRRHRMVARSAAMTTSSRSKRVPGAVAMVVHRFTHAARPIYRAPSGAGAVFSMTQSPDTISASALGSCRWKTSLKRRMTSAVSVSGGGVLA